jgi:hypothetical protein
MRRKRRNNIKFGVPGRMGKTRDGKNAIKSTMAAGVRA